MTRLVDQLLIAACALLPLVAWADADVITEYDRHLCRNAQRLLVNAGGNLPVIEQKASGNGFHTIQMGIDLARGSAVVAMTTERIAIDGQMQPTYVACKMVDRDRINDMLGKQLQGPDRQCRDVNVATYKLALEMLEPAARTRYVNQGRQLIFADDVITATGGEWLPITLDEFIAANADNDLVVSSPSVRVPWNTNEKNFYQGTQHCKLITLASMLHWMTDTSFDSDSSLVPRQDEICTQPHSMTSTAGSCLFYFAPANAMFCQDYSGQDWNLDAATAECSKRHASAEALKSADNRYEGTGGIFSSASCSDREETPSMSGTCVFHCMEGDETLWHLTGAVDPRMTQGCDLFIKR